MVLQALTLGVAAFLELTRTFYVRHVPRYFPGTAVTNDHTLGGFRHRSLLSHSSRGWRSDTKVWAGGSLLQALRGILGLPLSRLPEAETVLGDLWLVAASPPLSPCPCACLSLLKRTLVIGVGPIHSSTLSLFLIIHEDLISK